MSKIKTSSTSSEPAVHAEKELWLSRQQAEMKAGEALFREASQKITRQRENAQADSADAEQKEEKEQNQPKDTAQLSDLHLRSYAGKSSIADETLKWVLEMAGKDWEAFYAWLPKPGMPLSEQLEELSKLYLKLLEAAFKYAEGENLAWQLERLDALLAQKLNDVVEKNLEQLTILLREAGEDAAMDGVRVSLYRQTAGRTLSPQAAHRLFIWEASAGDSPSFSGKSVNVPSSASWNAQDARHQQTKQRQASAACSFSGEGMIYQPSRKQNLRFQQVYYGQQNSWKEQIRQRKEMIHSAKKGIAENNFQKAGRVLCSGKELEMANRFAAHVNGRGNLFQNPEISAGNEEVTGLLAAIMTMKGQVYAVENGRSSSLALSLQKAIEKIIDHHLRQKGIANIYYHTLSAYSRMKNPQKAIKTGQVYAYQQFREKQKDPAYQKSAAYSRESGFFHALLKKMSPEKEFALGSNIIKKDWESFLQVLGKTEKSSYLSRAERYSPWGILLEPEMMHSTGSIGNITKILLALAVFVALAVLAVLFLYNY